MLGMVPIGALNTLLLDPALPTWMPELILRDLRTGHGSDDGRGSQVPGHQM